MDRRLARNFLCAYRVQKEAERGKPQRLFEQDIQIFGLFGERGGTRTLDPMIKSHVLYRLSYALTRRAV
jgi:hypothetical protein